MSLDKSLFPLLSSAVESAKHYGGRSGTRDEWEALIIEALRDYEWEESFRELLSASLFVEDLDETSEAFCRAAVDPSGHGHYRSCGRGAVGNDWSQAGYFSWKFPLCAQHGKELEKDIVRWVVDHLPGVIKSFDVHYARECNSERFEHELEKADTLIETLRERVRVLEDRLAKLTVKAYGEEDSEEINLTGG